MTCLLNRVSDFDSFLPSITPTELDFEVTNWLKNRLLKTKINIMVTSINKYKCDKQLKIIIKETCYQNNLGYILEMTKSNN